MRRCSKQAVLCHTNPRRNTMEPNKIYTMNFARIYPLLVQKAERKNRT